jgi:hypothetical protein
LDRRPHRERISEGGLGDVGGQLGAGAEAHDEPDEGGRLAGVAVRDVRTGQGGWAVLLEAAQHEFHAIAPFLLRVVP